jgi:hypothetical protein
MKITLNKFAANKLPRLNNRSNRIDLYHQLREVQKNISILGRLSNSGKINKCRDNTR